MTSLIRFGRAMALASVLALGAATAQAQPAVKVGIDNFDFSPMTLNVPVGGTVSWTNNDDIPHTVRAVDGSFHSKPLDTGDSFSFTFAKPGVYSYFCSIHPKMLGKIVVK
jgi:plastocyanin